MRADGAAEYGRPYGANSLSQHTKVFRRRKRKLEGRDIELEFEGRVIKVTRKDKGIYCRNCGCFKAWKDVDFRYESRDGKLVRSMVCECGNYLKEEEL